MVIVVVPSFGNGGLNETMNPRFGRCDSFTFVTIEDKSIKEVKAVSNMVKIPVWEIQFPRKES